jgi:hypothetical protein
MISYSYFNHLLVWNCNKKFLYLVSGEPYEYGKIEKCGVSLKAAKWTKLFYACILFIKWNSALKLVPIKAFRGQLWKGKTK